MVGNGENLNGRLVIANYLKQSLLESPASRSFRKSEEYLPVLAKLSKISFLFLVEGGEKGKV